MTSVPDYYNRVNNELLALVPPGFSCVVEVGCGAGAFAKEYRKTSPSTRYLGIEASNVAAQYALDQHRLDYILVGDAEEMRIEALLSAGEEVDCIIYGDVLEHFKDPWKVLSEHAKHLKQNGVIIACIPNIGHMSMIFELLHGRWTYQSQGLLDKTHLRFFTLPGITELLSSAGLTIRQIVSRVATSKEQDYIVRAFFPLCRKFGIRQEDFIQRVNTLQYMVVAGKD